MQSVIFSLTFYLNPCLLKYFANRLGCFMNFSVRFTDKKDNTNPAMCYNKIA